MSAEILFTVDGQPVPKGRPRFGKHAYTPKRTRQYEKVVKHRAFQAVMEANRREKWRTDLRYSVSLFLFFGDARKRDLDNCAKAITDALNGVAYEDDAQIDELYVVRYEDKDRPRAVVSVRSI